MFLPKICSYGVFGEVIKGWKIDELLKSFNLAWDLFSSKRVLNTFWIALCVTREFFAVLRKFIVFEKRLFEFKYKSEKIDKLEIFIEKKELLSKNFKNNILEKLLLSSKNQLNSSKSDRKKSKTVLWLIGFKKFEKKKI